MLLLKVKCGVGALVRDSFNAQHEYGTSEAHKAWPNARVQGVGFLLSYRRVHTTPSLEGKQQNPITCGGLSPRKRAHGPTTPAS